jgi:carbonic anhydrase
VTDQAERERLAQALEDAAEEIRAEDDDNWALQTIERVASALTVYAEAKRKGAKQAALHEANVRNSLERLRPRENGFRALRRQQRAGSA